MTCKSRMTTYQLLVAYFVKKHPEIWSTKLRVDESLYEDAWRAVARDIHGEENSAEMVKYAYSLWISEFGFATSTMESINIARMDLPDVATYGNVVGYDVDLFSVDELTAMRAIAKMKRVYDRNSGKNFCTDVIRKDPEGFKKWGFLKIGGSLDDLRTYFGERNVDRETVTEEVKKPKVNDGFGRGGFFNDSTRPELQTDRYERDRFENGKGGFVQKQSAGFEPRSFRQCEGPPSWNPKKNRFDQKQTCRFKEPTTHFRDINSETDNDPFNLRCGRNFNAPFDGEGFGGHNRPDNFSGYPRANNYTEEKPKSFTPQYGGYLKASGYGEGFGGETKTTTGPTKILWHEDNGAMNFDDMEGFGCRGSNLCKNPNTEEEQPNTTDKSSKKGELKARAKKPFWAEESTQRIERTTVIRGPLCLRDDLQNYEEFYTSSTMEDCKKLNDNSYKYRVMNDEYSGSDSSSEDEEDEKYESETFGPEPIKKRAKVAYGLAQTVYGTIQANEYCQALELLNNEDNLDLIKLVREKVEKGETLTSEEEHVKTMMEAEQTFIYLWKKENSGKPLSKLNPAEVKLIISKEKKFDLCAQKVLAETIRDEEEAWRLEKCDGPNVTTPYGSFYEKDHETSFALNWINEHANMDPQPRGMLSIQAHKHLRNRLGRMLGCEGQFLDKVAKELKMNPASVATEKGIYVEQRLEEKQEDEARLKDYKSMAGAPKDLPELYFALEMLKIQKTQQMLGRNQYCVLVDNFHIRTDRETAADLTWLNNSENAAQVAYVREQIRNGTRFNKADRHVIQKLATERIFVMDWRMENFKGRTDFELMVLVPKEFAYIQRKEKEFRELDELAEREKVEQLKKRSVNAIKNETATSSARITEDDDTLYADESIEVGAEQVIEEVTEAILDLSLGLEGASPSASTHTTLVENIHELKIVDVNLYGADTIEVAAEQVVEDFSDEEFVLAGQSPSPSSDEPVVGNGTRTHNLMRIITDVLSALERSNPAEYQNKESALLRLMKLH